MGHCDMSHYGTCGRVISELAKSSKTKKKPNPPFRESKLTYILKESRFLAASPSESVRPCL